ncbi:MAG: hypothetical protein HYR49_04900 [Gammaproteobacteria bacterium]|nr:hypothetical protein [Gammaproteobacteria bacterium]
MLPGKYQDTCERMIGRADIHLDGQAPEPLDYRFKLGLPDTALTQRCQQNVAHLERPDWGHDGTIRNQAIEKTIRESAALVGQHPGESYRAVQHERHQ